MNQRRDTYGPSSSASETHGRSLAVCLLVLMTFEYPSPSTLQGVEEEGRAAGRLGLEEKKELGLLECGTWESEQRDSWMTRKERF